jgi:hypothetical protein
MEVPAPGRGARPTCREMGRSELMPPRYREAGALRGDAEKEFCGVSRHAAILAAPEPMKMREAERNLTARFYFMSSFIF